ncbi:MAG: hypothetical protein IJ917_01045, partial [Firmicutes bacterium]|nr:hypothetical protein [Bacillota bacterium]
MWIDQNGNTWYKGNLHMHTQVSDGDLPFEEAVALYRKAGYDFLAITDHRKRFGGYIETSEGRILCASEAQDRVLADGDTVEEALFGQEDYRFLVIPSTEFDRNF